MVKAAAGPTPTPQTGRTSFLTATGGLDFETALIARDGGDVVLAGRNPGKGAAAIADGQGNCALVVTACWKARRASSTQPSNS